MEHKRPRRTTKNSVHKNDKYVIMHCIENNRISSGSKPGRVFDNFQRTKLEENWTKRQINAKFSAHESELFPISSTAFDYFAQMSDEAFEILRPTLQDMLRSPELYYPIIHKKPGRWENIRETIKSLVSGNRKKPCMRDRTRRKLGEESSSQQPSVAAPTKETFTSTIAASGDGTKPTSKYSLVLLEQTPAGLSQQCVVAFDPNLSRSCLREFSAKLKQHFEAYATTEVGGGFLPPFPPKDCACCRKEVMDLPTYVSLECSHRACTECKNKSYRKHGSVYCKYCASYTSYTWACCGACGVDKVLQTTQDEYIAADGVEYGRNSLNRGEAFLGAKEVTIAGFSLPRDSGPLLSVPRAASVEIIDSNMRAVLGSLFYAISVSSRLCIIHTECVNECIGKLMCDAVSMQHLCLNDCGIDDNGFAAVVGAAEKLRGLRELHLNKNRLGPSNGVRLAYLLSLCPDMQVMHLNINRLGLGAIDLFRAAKAARNLKCLAVAGNSITYNTQGALSDLIREGALELLTLSDNELQQEEVKQVSAALGDPRSRLRVVWMKNLRVGDEGAAIIAEGLRRNRSLRILGIGSNCITDKGAVCLAEALKENNALRGLYLRYNSLTKVSALAFGEALEVNRSLEWLGFNKVGLEDEDAEAVKHMLERAKYLDEIGISGNNFSEQVKCEIEQVKCHPKVEIRVREMLNSATAAVLK